MITCCGIGRNEWAAAPLGEGIHCDGITLPRNLACHPVTRGAPFSESPLTERLGHSRADSARLLFRRRRRCGVVGGTRQIGFYRFR